MYCNRVVPYQALVAIGHSRSMLLGGALSQRSAEVDHDQSHLQNSLDSLARQLNYNAGKNYELMTLNSDPLLS